VLFVFSRDENRSGGRGSNYLAADKGMGGFLSIVYTGCFLILVHAPEMQSSPTKLRHVAVTRKVGPDSWRPWYVYYPNSSGYRTVPETPLKPSFTSSVAIKASSGTLKGAFMSHVFAGRNPNLG